MLAEDKQNWNNALRTSIVVHIFILLISWLFRLQDDPTQNIDTQYAVTVSFQTVDFKNTRSSNSTRSQSAAGAQRQQSQAPQKIETSNPVEIDVPQPTPPKPTPTPPVTDPQPTEPVISETTVEESDIQAVEEDLEIEDPEPEYIPEDVPQPEPSEEAVILNPELPTIEDIIGDISDDPIETEEEKNIPSDSSENGSDDATSGGTGSSDPSLKDGSTDGSGKSNSGDGRGRDNGGNDNDSGIGTGDYGEGEFDASGDGIFGRKVIYRDPSMVRLASHKTGRISFKVCISRRGAVSYLEINEVMTTINDRQILRNALESMRKYKYEPDYTAPREQCGQFTVIVDNFQGIR